VQMDYDSEPQKKFELSDYKEQTDREFRLLTKRFKEVQNRLKAVKTIQARDARRLSWLRIIQQCLVGVGYVCLLILSTPVR
jgi:ribosomal protein RSM22 (predicted rRNA methylase)